MKLQTAIKKEKQKLISKVKKKGLYENFGQKEVRKLKDKYNYNDLIYGTENERREAHLIEKFNTWCMNFDLSI